MPAHVVLADCSSRSGLAVTRSLGRYGLKIIVVSRTASNLVTKSRFAGPCLVGPDPRERREAYARFIVKVARQYNARLIIPVTDDAVSALDDSRQLFSGVAPLALATSDAVTRVLDKRKNLDMAREVGVPCAHQYELQSQTPASAVISTLGLPIVLKDPAPNQPGVKNPQSFRVAIARSVSELERLLDVVENSDIKPLCQEFVFGERVCVCLFAVGGAVVAMHGYVSERKTKHEGIARKIIELDSRLKEYATRMIAELGWTGIAHMEFIVDEVNGPKYIETNGRFWASTQGSINAGWDFPLWVYRYFVDGLKPKFDPIEVGCRTVYRKTDLEQLLIYLAGGRSPTFPNDPGKLTAIWQFFRDFAPSVHSDVWMWADPWPGIYDLLQDLRWLNVRRLFSRQWKATMLD